MSVSSFVSTDSLVPFQLRRSWVFSRHPPPQNLSFRPEGRRSWPSRSGEISPQRRNSGLVDGFGFYKALKIADRLERGTKGGRSHHEARAFCSLRIPRSDYTCTSAGTSRLLSAYALLLAASVVRLWQSKETDACRRKCDFPGGCWCSFRLRKSIAGSKF